MLVESYLHNTYIYTYIHTYSCILKANYYKCLTGYAWETEIVSCLAWNIRFNNSKKTDPQLILAGDPEQLGPIVRSSAALAGGLGISFLERLLKTESVYGKVRQSVCHVRNKHVDSVSCLFFFFHSSFTFLT